MFELLPALLDIRQGVIAAPGFVRVELPDPLIDGANEFRIFAIFGAVGDRGSHI
jgi:hypothetical protein